MDLIAPIGSGEDSNVKRTIKRGKSMELFSEKKKDYSLFSVQPYSIQDSKDNYRYEQGK